MTKQKLLILGLLFLKWSLNSKAELKIQFDHDAERNVSLQKIATDFWFNEEQYWRLVPTPKTVDVDFSLVSKDHLAQTRGHRISFNVYSEPKDLSSTLKHELAHVFLGTQCPAITDPFTQELFAYWRSQDYLRLLYRNKNAYTKSDAFKKLVDNGPFDEDKNIAVARIINEVVKRDSESTLKDWFQELFKQCHEEKMVKSQNQLKSQFIKKLQGPNLKKDETTAWGFLVFDSLANEVIESDGNWKAKQPVGSTLKPFLVTFFQDLKKTKNRGAGSEWECAEPTRKKWNVSAALNFSCNGFFLDSTFSKLELENYVDTLNRLTHSNYEAQWLNMADVIGLWPTIKLSLEDLARVYDYILDRDPKTIEVLKNTAQHGTLSELAVSKWFSDHEIALKSGTTTGFDLSVEKGFIAAVIPSNGSPKIAILYRYGQRPADLLVELKSRIEKYTNPDGKARVQVLSLFNLEMVQISCPTLILKNGDPIKERNVSFNFFKNEHSKLTCVGSAFEVTAPDRINRRLYGDLSFASSPNILAPTSQTKNEKNARARKGSQLILTTSEGHYIKSVFFSEMQNQRNELKKAMLLVIKNNLAFWQTKKQPICDSTICQVFNLGYEVVSENQKESLTQLILEMGNLNLGEPKWLEYSLGGQEPWQQQIKFSDVLNYLKTSSKEKVEGQKKKDRFLFRVGANDEVSFSCESVRSNFQLLSCPETLQTTDAGEAIFRGRGEGHERGMDLVEANQMAIQGFDFAEILANYYDLKVHRIQSK